jgi:hypothetical protein
MPKMWRDFSIVAKPFIKRNCKKEYTNYQVHIQSYDRAVQQTTYDDKKAGKENSRRKKNVIKLN